MFAALEAIAFKLNYCLSIQFSLGFLLLPNIPWVALLFTAIVSSSGHNTSLIKINVCLASPEEQCMCIYTTVHTHVNTKRCTHPCTCITHVCAHTQETTSKLLDTWRISCILVALWDTETLNFYSCYCLGPHGSMVRSQL